MYEIFKVISECLFIPVLTFFLAITAIYFFQKEKIYRYECNTWLDIKSNPIPKDIKGFIATDGKYVDYIYIINWGPYGEIYFNFRKDTYVTYWQPLPDAPKKE